MCYPFDLCYVLLSTLQCLLSVFLPIRRTWICLLTYFLKPICCYPYDKIIALCHTNASDKILLLSSYTRFSLINHIGINGYKLDVWFSRWNIWNPHQNLRSDPCRVAGNCSHLPRFCLASPGCCHHRMCETAGTNSNLSLLFCFSEK